MMIIGQHIPYIILGLILYAFNCQQNMVIFGIGFVYETGGVWTLS